MHESRNRKRVVYYATNDSILEMPTVNEPQKLLMGISM